MQLQSQIQEEPALSPVDMLPRARQSLGSLLIDAGIATDDQVAEAVREGAETGERLGEVVLRQGLATEEEVAILLARQWQLEFATEDLVTVADTPYEGDELAQLGAIPVRLEGKRTSVAVCDPHQAQLESIRTLLGEQTEFVVVTKSAFDALAETWAGMRQAGATGALPGSEPSALHEPAVEHEYAAEHEYRVEHVPAVEQVPEADDEPAVARESEPCGQPPAVQVEVEPEYPVGVPSTRPDGAPELDPDGAALEVESVLAPLEQDLAKVQVLRARWQEMTRALAETRAQLEAVQAGAEQNRHLADELRRLASELAG
jgi:hypothetical protein